jgi:septum formation protein
VPAQSPTSILLGSSSPRRVELLQALCIHFSSTAPDVDEELVEAQLNGCPPSEIATGIARAKAEAILARHPDATVLTADTMVICQGKSLGKPRDQTEALAILRTLSGRWHEVITGVVIQTKDFQNERAVVSRVQLNNIAEAELLGYVKTGEPLDKAGAYGIQGLGGQLVQEVDGCLLNVVGLPLCAVSELINTAWRTTSEEEYPAICTRVARDVWARSVHGDGFPFTSSAHP